MKDKRENTGQTPIIRAHILRNGQFTYWQSEIEGNWSYQQLYDDGSWRVAQGFLWGTYAKTRAFDEVQGHVPVRLFRYHPDNNQFDWFGFGLSRKSDKQQLVSGPVQKRTLNFHQDQTRHKEGLGFCDAMVFGGKQYIYAGTTAGTLCRIDTQNLNVEKVANVMPARRLPALTLDPKRILYGRLKGFEMVNYTP